MVPWPNLHYKGNQNLLHQLLYSNSPKWRHITTTYGSLDYFQTPIMLQCYYFFKAFAHEWMNPSHRQYERRLSYSWGQILRMRRYPYFLFQITVFPPESYLMGQISYQQYQGAIGSSEDPLSCYWNPLHRPPATLQWVGQLSLIYTATVHLDMLKPQVYTPWHSQKAWLQMKVGLEHAKKVVSSNLIQVKIWVNPTNVFPIKWNSLVNEWPIDDGTWYWNLRSPQNVVITRQYKQHNSMWIL